MPCVRTYLRSVPCCKVTNRPYIDDLKMFLVGEANLKRVLWVTKAAMEDVDLEWNENKFNLVHIRKGAEVQDATGFKSVQVKVDGGRRTADGGGRRSLQMPRGARAPTLESESNSEQRCIRQPEKALRHSIKSGIR